MSANTDPSTGKKAPDTATSYERAKPEKESPSKQLDAPKPPQGQHQDKVTSQAVPSSQKRTE